MVGVHDSYSSSWKQMLRSRPATRDGYRLIRLEPRLRQEVLHHLLASLLGNGEDRIGRANLVPFVIDGLATRTRVDLVCPGHRGLVARRRFYSVAVLRRRKATENVASVISIRWPTRKSAGVSSRGTRKLTCKVCLSYLLAWIDLVHS